MPILIKRTDGGVSVMRLGVVEGLTKTETLTKAIESWKELHVGQYVSHEEVPDSVIPADRTFRNAWMVNSGKVEHDMEKCRSLHRDRLRAMRTEKLAALDVDYMRADESGDIQKKNQIAQLKQKLRDVTADPMIDAAETPEELKLVIPDVLR